MNTRLKKKKKILNKDTLKTTNTGTICIGVVSILGL